MRVILSRRALADIVWITGKIAEHNRSAAARTEQHIADAIDRLGVFPELGYEKKKLGTRVWIVRVHRRKYTIYYRINDEAVVISHIRDGRRALPKSGDI
jgi:plasmid stabilization system protein ParE